MARGLGGVVRGGLQAREMREGVVDVERDGVTGVAGGAVRAVERGGRGVGRVEGAGFAWGVGGSWVGGWRRGLGGLVCWGAGGRSFRAGEAVSTRLGPALGRRDVLGRLGALVDGTGVVGTDVAVSASSVSASITTASDVAVDCTGGGAIPPAPDSPRWRLDSLAKPIVCGSVGIAEGSEGGSDEGSDESSDSASVSEGTSFFPSLFTFNPAITSSIPIIHRCLSASSSHQNCLSFPFPPFFINGLLGVILFKLGILSALAKLAPNVVLFPVLTLSITWRNSSNSISPELSSSTSFSISCTSVASVKK